LWKKSFRKRIYLGQGSSKDFFAVLLVGMACPVRMGGEEVLGPLRLLKQDCTGADHG
jgi:hypothetical protein